MAVDKTRFAKRYEELKERMRAGEITDLVVDPRWSIRVNDVHICVVEAEFCYRLVQRGTLVAEFMSARNSAVHAMKKRLLKACFGIEAQEVPA